MQSLLLLPLLLLAPELSQSAAPPAEKPAATQELPAPAKSAQEVRPLLPGAAVPAVSVTYAGDQRLDLAAFVKEGPAIVVFYRGGW